jgi:mRNA interferase MazF
MKHQPSRGDVWLARLEPTEGHEQGGTRPAVVLSIDLFNQGPAELIVVCPVTSRDRFIPLHVRIEPPEGGLKSTSFAMPEMIRSISVTRLKSFWGTVTGASLAQIEQRVCVLLGLKSVSF